VLNDESKKFHFLLTEQAVRLKRAADAVVADQLRHMIDLSRRPNGTVSILQPRAGERRREGFYRISGH
jgi:hypothetical protein